MEKLTRPEYSFHERLHALRDPELKAQLARELRLLMSSLFSPSLFSTRIKIAGSAINQSILSERLPHRKPDGSMDWANYCAARMELNRPVSRQEIFPNGTHGMSENDIIDQAHDFLEPYSTRWNFGKQTTVFDPHVLPEVIDIDFRDSVMNLNQLPFLLSGASCSGHPEGRYQPSNVAFVYDARSVAVDDFYNKVTEICNAFNRDDVSAWIHDFGNDGDLGTLKISLIKGDLDHREAVDVDIARRLRDEFWGTVGDIPDKL